MPQGKTKIKVSQPAAQVKKTIVKKKKAGGSTQKKNRPALPKPSTNTLRSAITRSINEANENAAKERATLDGKSFRVLPAPESMGSASKAKGKK